MNSRLTHSINDFTTKNFSQTIYLFFKVLQCQKILVTQIFQIQSRKIGKRLNNWTKLTKTGLKMHVFCKRVKGQGRMPLGEARIWHGWVNRLLFHCTTFTPPQLTTRKILYFGKTFIFVSTVWYINNTFINITINYRFPRLYPYYLLPHINSCQYRTFHFFRKKKTIIIIWK